MNPISVDELKDLYKAANFKRLIRILPHMRKIDDPFVKFLVESDLLYMKKWCDLKDGEPAITIGADPEFILQDKKTKEVVLFSSKIANDVFNLSEAAIGADYGLLEIRTPICHTPKELIKKFNDLFTQFHESYESLHTMECEAVEFDHQRQRILESMQDKDIQYGPVHNKAIEVWNSPETIDSSLVAINQTLSAYDNPVFAPPNSKILTAGGHIHVGGPYIKMLSLSQMKALIRKIDGQVLPICREAETQAGELRRSVYGFPGEFRVKDYGFEYRSLSNAVFKPKNKKALKKILEIMIQESRTFAIGGSHV